MSRYSADLEGLFSTLVASVNGDHEIAKIRTCMGKLARKPGEMIQTALYKLRAQYEMILQISFPGMDEDTVTLRADNFSSNCCKYFVSSNTALICEQYISYKITRGDTNTVLKISNLVTQHEAVNSKDRISTTHYLPESACRMDLQMFTCSNIEDLVIASANLKLSDRRSKSPYDKKDDKKFPPYRNYSKSPSQGRYDNTKSRSSYEQRDRSSSKDKYYRKDSRGRQNQGKSYREEKDYKYQPGRERSKTSSRERYSKRRNDCADRDKSSGDRNRRNGAGADYQGRTSERSTSKTRGRSPVHRDSRTQNCIRCGDNHLSGTCPRYAYYEGTPCSICNKLHRTKDHRGRSGSYDKNSRQNRDKNGRAHVPDFKYRDIDNFQSQLQGATFPSDDPGDYNIFKKN